MKEFAEPAKHVKDVTELPRNGWGRDAVVDAAKLYLGLGEVDWTQGMHSGTVYNGEQVLAI